MTHGFENGRATPPHFPEVPDMLYSPVVAVIGADNERACSFDKTFRNLKKPYFDPPV